MWKILICFSFISSACGTPFDTPLFHVFDKDPPPDATLEHDINIYDPTGKVDFAEVTLIIEELMKHLTIDKGFPFEGLTIAFTPTRIAWIENGQQTTVAGYYEPNLNYIEVAYTSDMNCLLATALAHELLHRAEDTVGRIDRVGIENEMREALNWRLCRG